MTVVIRCGSPARTGDVRLGLDLRAQCWFLSKFRPERWFEPVNRDVCSFSVYVNLEPFFVALHHFEWSVVRWLKWLPHGVDSDEDVSARLELWMYEY